MLSPASLPLKEKLFLRLILVFPHGSAVRRLPGRLVQRPTQFLDAVLIIALHSHLLLHLVLLRFLAFGDPELLHVSVRGRMEELLRDETASLRPEAALELALLAAGGRLGGRHAGLQARTAISRDTRRR